MLPVQLRKLYSACVPLLMAAVIGSCSLTGDELVALDLRGNWLLIAVHQTEPELNIRYSFVLTEQGDDEFVASATQYLINTSIWDTPVDVQGRISFEGSNMRLEFDYPDSGDGPEVALLSYGRVSQTSSLVVVTGHSYVGESVGIRRPQGDIFGYNTEDVSMEQTAQ
jgi:hypothetical protein